MSNSFNPDFRTRVELEWLDDVTQSFTQTGHPPLICVCAHSGLTRISLGFVGLAIIFISHISTLSLLTFDSQKVLPSAPRLQRFADGLSLPVLFQSSPRRGGHVQLRVILALAPLSDWFRGDLQLNVTARCHRIPGDRSLTNHRARRCGARVAVLNGDFRIGESCADDRLRLCQVHANDQGHARRI